MTRLHGRVAGRAKAVFATVALVLCSCSGSDAAQAETTSTTAAPPSTIVSTTRPLADVLAALPVEARAATGGGDPRPPAYWAVWNTCAPDNRAAEAEANGGRAAGWVLVDDILADPGIGLGDHILTGCEEAVALLRGRTGDGEVTADPVYTLAAQLLAAELNLNVGAASCPVAEETVFGAHLVLATAGFDGVSASPLDAEAGGALPRLVELLQLYNSGELCR